MRIKQTIASKGIIHTSFEISLLIKGIDGLMEIIGGMLLIFLNPGRLNRLTLLLTQHELSEDPKDVIANLLITFSHSFSVSTQAFGVFYLISHGILKCIIIFLLWRKKLWAYPLSIIVLVLFIAYQIYRYFMNHSLFLILLTAFDIVVIVLTILEYRRLNRRSNQLNVK